MILSYILAINIYLELKLSLKLSEAFINFFVSFIIKNDLIIIHFLKKSFLMLTQFKYNIIFLYFYLIL
jgi:hypothetical protein